MEKNWKEILKSILSEVCDTKFDTAWEKVGMQKYIVPRFEVKKVLQLYLKYLRQELGFEQSEM